MNDFQKKSLKRSLNTGYSIVSQAVLRLGSDLNGYNIYEYYEQDPINNRLADDLLPHLKVLVDCSGNCPPIEGTPKTKLSEVYKTYSNLATVLYYYLSEPSTSKQLILTNGMYMSIFQETSATANNPEGNKEKLYIFIPINAGLHTLALPSFP